MNLLLLNPEHLLSETKAVVRGEDAAAKIKEHDLTAGITVCAGIAGGKIGHATVTSLSADQITFSLTLDRDPPPRHPIIAVVAACRPQTVKKVIQAAVTLGITELHFVRTERVEKSYLTSNALQPEQIAIEIEKGLSQAVDTVAPLIQVHQKFLNFFEDTLPERLQKLGWTGAKKLLADMMAPKSEISPMISNVSSRWVIAIGPEAGWSDFERVRLAEMQFQVISLGARILRVETAVTVLIARLIAQP